MVYRITYRNEESKLQSIEIEAESRSLVFVELKRLGISAVRIEESSSKRKAPILSGSRKNRGINIRIVAAIIITVVCAASYVFLRDGYKDGTEAAKEPPKAGKLAKEGKLQPIKAASPSPDILPSPVATPDIKEEESKKEHRPVTEEDMVNPVNTNRNIRVVKLKPQPKRIFRHTSEELIAGLLDTMPGDMVIGDIPYWKFENDFVSAAIDKVEINDDDTEEERELKIAVEETKKEIREIMAREGKSFADIMTEARQEQQSLAQYRFDIEDELRKIRKSGEYDADEYDQFVDAINRMLENKGAAPIRTPSVFYRQLKLHQQRKEMEQ